ncbi:hypothetical protein DP62_481 [Burkholderia pseudomallei]|uniref:hypothetical protein n=1 Tax=Burkholderia pseudomallei TaxID=28450 RepID=UPI00050EB2D3|nr:hypothetical protein [Burkholderia pseudomallei]KGC90953.1 hypothetical protein DP62_481 [Burkholderia pseudomallei]
MALDLLSLEDLSASCRRRIESCELWLRRLIDDKFKSAFGADYINKAKIGDTPIFSKPMKGRVQTFLSANPDLYSRPIDTLLFDDLGKIIGKDDVYKSFFKDALDHGFPLGAPQVRHIVRTLVPLRNALSHANSANVSLHDAERVLCYCSDIIASIKTHYSTLSMNDKFPAPMFTRFSDSLGNVRHISEPSVHYALPDQLHLEDEIRFEVEVDASFLPEEYEIVWQVCNVDPQKAERGTGPVFILKIKNYHVGELFAVQALVTSNKEWHRLQNIDGRVVCSYVVLPLPK